MRFYGLSADQEFLLLTTGEAHQPTAVAICLDCAEGRVTFTSNPNLIAGHREPGLLDRYSELRQVLAASPVHHLERELTVETWPLHRHIEELVETALAAQT